MKKADFYALLSETGREKFPGIEVGRKGKMLFGGGKRKNAVEGENKQRVTWAIIGQHIPALLEYFYAVRFQHKGVGVLLPETLVGNGDDGTVAHGFDDGRQEFLA